MTTLRDAVIWCLGLRVPWSADDVAEMARLAPAAVRGYLTTLEKSDIVRRDGAVWRAGDAAAIRAYRLAKPKTQAGGRSAAYRAAHAVRERLLRADAAANRAGLTSNSRQILPQPPKQPFQELPMADGAGVSLQEAARALGVCVNTVRNWNDKGIIRCGRTPGGHRRVPESEIIRLRAQILADFQQQNNQETQP